MKNKALYLLLAVSVFYMTGCETVQRKFTPKKKTPSHVASSIFFEEGAYQKKFSNDYYYKTHYTLWRTWHDELLQSLGGNDKKANRAAEEAVGNLQQMQQYLVPDKFAQLQIIINDLEAVIKRMDQASGTSQIGPFRTELERIRRAVGNDFYYDKVKESLLADKVDLGNQDEGKASEPVTPEAA